ncbi:CRP/FNR family cyclic AMP-dependent transcriptional regulator [Marmoricola sp. OAE513]|uniref:cyclic nucleotide-binding domain-containing protein n=1 Tax=Marmoricola sp. OAE513 TaxID=2817894 RepID=UPI001D708176
MGNRSMTSTSPAPRSGRDEVDGAFRRLRALGTFAGATDAELRAVVAAGTLVTVPAGWSLIWDRTPADKAYVVLDGTVEVRRGDDVVATLAGGDVIGEVAILDRSLRTATVTATTPLSVLHFVREQVERLYAEVPAVRRALDSAAAERS